MSVREVKWRKDNAGACVAEATRRAEHGFITVDPGSTGVALAWRPLSAWGERERPLVVSPLKGRTGAVEFAECLGHRMFNLTITEEPFIGRSNVQSALVTSRSVGFIQGALAATRGDMLFLMVPAQSWQAVVLPRSLGGRAERKAEAVRLASERMGDDTRWLGANAELRSAIADAIGMAVWWQSVRGRHG